MREVSVVGARDGEHPDDIEDEADSNGNPANTEPERHDARDVDGPKGTLLDQVDPLKVILYRRVAVIHSIPFTN